MNRLFYRSSLIIVFLGFTCAAENSDTIKCLDAHYAQLYPSSWHMLEDIFIQQPRVVVDAWFGKKTLVAALAAAGGTGAFLLSKAGIQSLNQSGLGGSRYPYLERKQTLIASGSAVATFGGMYATLRSYYIGVEEKRQLARIVENWPCAKEFLPKQIHACLDELSKQYYQKGPQYSQNCDESIRLIKNAIYEHFPRKYSKKSWSEFFSEKGVYFYFNIDVLQFADRIYRFVRQNII